MCCELCTDVVYFWCRFPTKKGGLEQDNESEDEDAVEGMTIDTVSSPLSSDNEGEETGSSDEQSNPDNGEPDPGNEDSSDSSEVDPPSPKPEKSGMTTSSASLHKPAKGSAANPLSSPSLEKLGKSGTGFKLLVLSPSPPQGPATPDKTPVPPRTRPSSLNPGSAEDPSSSRVAKSKPNQNGTAVKSGLPVKSPPSELKQDSCNKSDIESLYASPSPERTVTKLELIELDSDPDFETMERMLLSHRGPSSQSQSIKKESTAQSPVPLQAKRPLKRQRSRSPSNKSSQAPTQDSKTDPKPTKRPRVNGPHSRDSVVVLNERRKHPEFWDLDGTVVLQVDDVIFRVMRSTFNKASPWFQRLFSNEHDSIEIMAGCPVYLIEGDLSHLDFANLLHGLENGL